jgi:hypothetical protein
VLKRSAEQETALQQLIDQQQDRSSSAYHQWLTPESLCCSTQSLESRHNWYRVRPIRMAASIFFALQSPVAQGRELPLATLPLPTPALRLTVVPSASTRPRIPKTRVAL